MSEQTSQAEILAFTTDIVAAHLSNNTVAKTDVSGLIEQIYRTLSGLAGGVSVSGGLKERLQPAVSVKKSVADDYIICLEDGKKLKMLKRHLKTAYNMTPEEYRERWNLPADYPMVAPSYAAQRSKLAKNIGLGKRGRKKKA